ncbi:unnamed protein product [Caenorhabditis sp. 36 PRJEB53466]|nr:unnamed protein product [Caenorhabditis sp. 36 PRJEB53466]
MMTFEELRTASFKYNRERWAPWFSLIPQPDDGSIFLGGVSEVVTYDLMSDIFDKFNDIRLREANYALDAEFYALTKVSLDKPEITKILAELKPVGLKILDVLVLSSCIIKTRKMPEVCVFVHLDTLNGEQVSNKEEPRSQLEKNAHTAISKFLAEQNRYHALTANDVAGQYVDKWKKSPQLSIKPCYQEEVPDIVRAGIYSKACYPFCPDIDMLVTVWYALMTERTREECLQGPADEEFSWLSIDQTAWLVIYFLQNCELLPLFMRETDIFIPANVTWEDINDWNNGSEIFTAEYFLEAQKRLACSPYVNVSVGRLFTMLLTFYVHQCPLGEVIINLDQGIIRLPDNEIEMESVIMESMLIRETDKTSRKLKHMKIWLNVLKAMLDHLLERNTGGCVMKDLLDIRKKTFAAEVKARKEATANSSKK